MTDNATDIEKRLADVKEYAILILCNVNRLERTHPPSAGVDLWRAMAADARCIERRAARSYKELPPTVGGRAQYRVLD